MFVRMKEPSRGIAPVWRRAKPTKKVSRDLGYHSDSIARWHDMGPLKLWSAWHARWLLLGPFPITLGNFDLTTWALYRQVTTQFQAIFGNLKYLVARINRPESLAIWQKQAHRRPDRSESPNLSHFASPDVKKHVSEQNDYYSYVTYGGFACLAKHICASPAIWGCAIRIASQWHHAIRATKLR